MVVGLIIYCSIELWCFLMHWTMNEGDHCQLERWWYDEYHYSDFGLQNSLERLRYIIVNLGWVLHLPFMWSNFDSSIAAILLVYHGMLWENCDLLWTERIELNINSISLSKCHKWCILWMYYSWINTLLKAKNRN